MKDSRVVVLGGTNGIGLAVARQAAAAGAQVVVVSRQQASVDSAVKSLPAGTRGHAIDLRSTAAVTALFAELGSFDHLVYTAGEELLMAPLLAIDLQKARAFFELRYWGAVGAVQAAQKHLSKTGSIVLTSGTAGTKPPPGFAIGSSICAAMEAFGRAMAIELAPIRVNVVVPGFVDTGLWANIPVDARQKMFAEAASKLPVGRIGKPDDIAEAYLSFMRGAYTTGQTLIVDGGGVLT